MAKQTTGSFTDTKRVRELIALMAENSLTEIELVEDKSKITLKRGGAYAAPAGAPAPVHHYAPAAAPIHSAPAAPAAAPAPAAEEKLLPIKSPMVGTFYTAANPEADAYVTIGTQVNEDSTLCIIEAMKVFNEIKNDPPVIGTIAKILVQNGQAVEYNQPLFMVKPL
jgi:acetyl-CoA carboxylase biotin carboxyl carrier protein